MWIGKKKTMILSRKGRENYFDRDRVGGHFNVLEGGADGGFGVGRFGQMAVLVIGMNLNLLVRGILE
jgi:hypothetical protein